MTRREMIGALAAAAPAALAQAPAEWVPLFDGKSLNGWKASGPPGSFKIVDGAIAADGPQSHLFYAGDVAGADFRSFELKLEVLARPLANSGVYFHTKWQEKGWPDEGFEVQINNSALGEGRYRERKRTGSLYGVRNTYKAFVRDNEWFPLEIAVRGKQVLVRLNGLLLVDYVEPNPPVQAPKTPGRILASGTFALQCHDPGSKAMFRNIMVRTLPDFAAVSPAPPLDDAGRELLRLGAANYPLVDYHVHVRAGWTIAAALEESRRHGIMYGIASNLGKNFMLQNDADALRYLETVKSEPVFTGLQCEGREWVGMISKETLAKFDYVFTDAMTWTDDSGKRMRTWIKEEVGEIADREKFMDTLVARIEGILTTEPVDIYANPTYIPDQLNAGYDELWTPARMARVIEAAKKHDVAIELNERYRVPSLAFVKAMKAAGLKFAFGANKSGPDIGRNEYGLQMVRDAGLAWSDFFVPKPAGEKPVEKRGLPPAGR